MHILQINSCNETNIVSQLCKTVEPLICYELVVKKVSSYIAQYLILRIYQSTLHITSLVQLNTISTSLGSIQPYATINA